jgi:hypothetical protein
MYENVSVQSVSVMKCYIKNKYERNKNNEIWRLSGKEVKKEGQQ